MVHVLFRDVFAGIDEGIDEQVEFGAFLKLVIQVLVVNLYNRPNLLIL
jgi:hypothetical protein